MMRMLRLWRDRLRHPERYRELPSLMQVPALSREALDRLQRERFDAIVRHAAEKTDFYARHFAGRLPREGEPIRPESLPVLGKQDVRECRDAMLARDVPRDSVRLGHTGGSTGEPLSFHYTPAKHALMLAAMKRGFSLSGWRPGERVMYLWGASRDVKGRGVLAHEHAGWLDSELSLPATSYSEASLAAWHVRIRQWRPVLLYGYASALGELARYMDAVGASPTRPLIGVYSTAEMLDPAQRRLMESAFGCKVFNQYGCREVPNIAWECRAGAMHVFSDTVQLEAAPDGGGGHRLLVTSLTDRVMPFIRYDLGDSGELLDEVCDCGLPFPLMRMSMCRHNDLIRVPGGARIHPSVLNGLLYGRSGIHGYQWVQRAPDRLRLNLVCAPPLAPPVVAQIEAGLREHVHPAMQLEMVYCGEIARSPAGKHRYVIGLD
ncbi:MAG: phenylacetate--CoA ligase family protein [Chromatiaceae bacterium]|nr:phenylacetate--CoA ligase family protein [Chromatiaceae bacterium]MCP5422999.1 phenylacetate--CoA ligase family protein [Chromatiaceae bacterium]